MKKAIAPNKKEIKKIKLKPPANYAPLFRFKMTDRDVIMDFGQSVEGNKILLISRIAMPLESAKELADLLRKTIDKQKK
jgi:hypothetical protein